MNRDSKNKFTLKISSKTENLEIIRDFMETVIGKIGFDEITIGAITLAVDEACSNVIRHAYHFDGRRKIDITVELNGSVLTITITDRGEGFDPKKIETAAQRLKKYARGGLGLALIKKVMDQVDFEIRPGVKNQIIMKKHIPTSNSA